MGCISIVYDCTVVHSSTLYGVANRVTFFHQRNGPAITHKLGRGGGDGKTGRNKIKLGYGL
jgi:hypothetical protein